MSTLRVGIGIAAAVAGWPLYSLVQAGTLDPGTALMRGGMVALACAVGARYVQGLVADYQAEQKVSARRRAAVAAFEKATAEAEAAQAAVEAAHQARRTGTTGTRPPTQP